MKYDPKGKGETSQAIILAELLRRGLKILMPFGDNQRYDIVLDDKGVFERIQCKTGRLRGGTIRFATCSTYGHRGRNRKTYVGEVDSFLVYCPETHEVYKIDMKTIGNQIECSLRVDPPKIKSNKVIKNAKDFFVK